MKTAAAFIIQIFPAVVFAQAADSVNVTPAEPVLTFWTVFRLILALALVLALIMATVWLVKKLNPGMVRTGSSGTIRILSATYLGPKKGLYLIKVLDRVILVGMTENSVQPITEFSGDEEAVRLLESEADKSGGGGFQNILSRLMQKGGGDKL